MAQARHEIGDRLIAGGAVINAGRTFTWVRAEVVAKPGSQEKLVAFPTATMMTIESQRDVRD